MQQASHIQYSMHSCDIRASKLWWIISIFHATIDTTLQGADNRLPICVGQSRTIKIRAKKTHEKSTYPKKIYIKMYHWTKEHTRKNSIDTTKASSKLCHSQSPCYAANKCISHTNKRHWLIPVLYPRQTAAYSISFQSVFILYRATICESLDMIRLLISLCVRPYWHSIMASSPYYTLG